MQKLDSYFQKIVISFLLQHLLQTPVFTTIYVMSQIKKKALRKILKVVKQIVPKQKIIKVIMHANVSMFSFL